MENLNAQPWYTSRVQISQVTAAVSAVIALFPKVGQLLGWTTPGDISNGVTLIFGAITVLAPIYGSIKRGASNIQPLTLTKAGAEVHPNTLANAPTPPPMASPPTPPHRGLL